MPLDYQPEAGVRLTKTAPALVFSDLDGTLLDHETYRYDEAAPALDAMRRSGAPLILASSKTSAEMAPLRTELGFEHCEAIVENGNGILEPFAETPTASRTHPHLLLALNRLPIRLRSRFSGFSEWTAQEVAARTGLDLEAAERARWRDFSEPGIWSGSDDELASFVRQLGEFEITAVRGGRFLTISFGGTKARRLLEIKGRYETPGGSRPPVMALGDAPNDLEMLEAADYAVIIPNPGNSSKLDIDAKADAQVWHAARPGPAGWNESVLQFLDSQGLI
jgi:mannosyl-3-phosphoglycerate phosphatase